MEIEISRDALEASLAKLKAEKHEAEIASLAESERLRRQREQEAADAAASQKAKIKDISKLEHKRLDAWAELEKATRAQLEAIGKVISATECERVLLADVTAAVPPQLGPFETKHRIRGRVGEFLHAAKINFEVPGARGIYASAALEDWRAVEAKAMTAYLQALTDGECE
jgi:hypothetical protein